MTEPRDSHVVRVHRTGGPDVLALERTAVPPPPPKHVRVRVHAAGVGYPDLLQRSGRLPVAKSPYTPGFEVAGVIDAVAEEGHGLRPGTRVVAALFPDGGYAEYVNVPVANVTAVPPAVSLDEAIALPIGGLTALLALRCAGHFTPGESVFVPGAAGGVGSLAVQLARLLGAHPVIAGASTEDKRSVARSLGADVVVDYTHERWVDEVRAATNGGVDVILEAGGGAFFEQCLRAIAPSGRLVVFGAEDVVHPSALDATKTLGLIRQAQGIAGFALLRVPESERRAALAELFDLVASRKLRVLSERYPLTEAWRAHAAMEARTAIGKVILRPHVATPRDLVARFEAAIQAFSPDALADLFSEDATYEFPFLNPGRPPRYDGREAIRAGFREVWVPGTVKVGEIRAVVHETADPEVVIEEGELDATQTSTGRAFVSRFVLVARVRDGRIVHLRDYTDALRVARAMGRLPSTVEPLAE